MSETNNFGYPGNGELPEARLLCNVWVRFTDERRDAKAYWSGKKWVAVNGDKISPGKVIRWEIIND